jgi:iron complex transport system substrate-binding protein
VGALLKLFRVVFRGEVNRVSLQRRFVWRAALALMGSCAAACVVGVCAAKATQAPAAGRTFMDAAGRTVTVPARVERIVTLAPNLTETVYALGAQDRLVGDTDYCDFPADARTKTHVGTPLSPSLEAIVALHPDVVLATRTINRRETVDSLARLGIPVYTTDARSLDDVLASISQIADVIGAGLQGEELVSTLRARMDRLATRLRPYPAKKVLFVIWLDPLITIGPRTFLADAVRRAGGESVIDSSQDWPQIGLEAIVKMQPEEIIFASDHTEGHETGITGMRTRPVWSELSAVKENHIAEVGEGIDRPAPRLVDAIEELARQLHPEAFAAPAAVPEVVHPSATETSPPGRYRMLIGGSLAESRACAR